MPKSLSDGRCLRRGPFERAQTINRRELGSGGVALAVWLQRRGSSGVVRLVLSWPADLGTAAPPVSRR